MAQAPNAQTLKRVMPANTPKATVRKGMPFASIIMSAVSPVASMVMSSRAALLIQYKRRVSRLGPALMDNNPAVDSNPHQAIHLLQAGSRHKVVNPLRALPHQPETHNIRKCWFINKPAFYFQNKVFLLNANMPCPMACYNMRLECDYVQINC